MKSPRSSRGIKTPAARAHPFLKLLPLLRRHLLPALPHPMAPVPAPPSRPASKSAEKNLAQDQKAEGLPVSEQMPSGRRRHHVIPQLHHDVTEEGEARDDERDESHETKSHFPNSS